MSEKKTTENSCADCRPTTKQDEKSRRPISSAFYKWRATCVFARQCLTGRQVFGLFGSTLFSLFAIQDANCDAADSRREDEEKADWESVGRK